MKDSACLKWKVYHYSCTCVIYFVFGNIISMQSYHKLHFMQYSYESALGDRDQTFSAIFSHFPTTLYPTCCSTANSFLEELLQITLELHMV